MESAQADDARAGMGTTLTVAYVGEDDLTVAHVGDSRLYRLRAGTFERLTDDHSLVEELVRQGKLTPEEADEHPQRSIITRALGAEEGVEADSTTWAGRDGDVYLICSDGLTSMIPEAHVARSWPTRRSLASAGRMLIDAANDAGGRDNITVVLFRLEDVAAGAAPPQETAEHRAVAPEPAAAAPAAAAAPGHRDGDGARGSQAAAPGARQRPGAPKAPRRACRSARSSSSSSSPACSSGPTTPRRPSTSSAPARRLRHGLPRTALRPAGRPRPLLGQLRVRRAGRRAHAGQRRRSPSTSCAPRRRAGPRRQLETGELARDDSARNRELLALVPASLLLTAGFAAVFIERNDVLSTSR
jgi:hypothetical protein